MYHAPHSRCDVTYSYQFSNEIPINDIILNDHILRECQSLAWPSEISLSISDVVIFISFFPCS